jgi:iron-sulfur cluster protein
MIKTPHDLPTYKKQLKRALENKFLGTALANFAAAFPAARANAFAGLDFEELRRGIAEAKDQALPNIMELYAEFKANAERAGVKVHLAQTAFEANRMIAEIGHANGVKKIVKSKSMTAEETFLNDHLEADGFDVVETDLGEWIIQKRHEGPSHMVMPAIHLSRGQVAELFGKVMGKEQDPDDIEGMVKAARSLLRQEFLEAGMGVSGANFAIAESGTIGLVTNEGNARLVTTLPPVHAALVGLDKLVPDLGTALGILKVLPKNATGQAISSYVTWITGANECEAGPQGRKEMHIIFLDNGRLSLAADPVFSQALRCIRCGACANVCPIYGLVGGHNYGHVYIGAIGLILTYFYHGRENARAIVQNCANCQACKAICPASIDLPALIKQVNGLVLAQEKKRPAKNRLLAAVLKDRKLFHFLLRRARLAQKPLADGDMVRHLPMLFSKEHEFRSLPVIASKPFRGRFKSLAKKAGKAKYRVALFGGCLMDFVYPEQGEAFLKLIKDKSIRVDYPLEQTCCGLPAAMLTETKTAKKVARQNLEAIDPADYDYIVTLCASCGSHLKESYPKLLADTPGLSVKARQFADKVIDFSSFMKEVAGQDKVEKGTGARTAYHAPCHLCRGLDVHEAPRELIECAGLQYAAYDTEEVCCGFGGSFSMTFPELSAEVLGKKLDAVEATGAEQLVTDCPGCVLQLRGGLDKRGSKVKVKHIAEVLAEAFARS